MLMLIFSLTTCFILLLVRIWWILPHHKISAKRRTAPCKTCIFLGSGGHTGEMLQLVKGLDPKQYQPRIYMMADSDILSEKKAIEHESSLTEGIFEVYKIPRARQVGQPWKTVPWTVFLALLTSVKVMINTYPDLIICNGPGSCVPICLLAYIPRIFGIKKIEIVYIESFARVNSLSLTGKLLYRFVDRFMVQWPELNKKLDRAEYKGILV